MNESENTGASAVEEIATLGGGCFWCLEPLFIRLRGVKSVMPGYAGGHVANPTYRQVCDGRTGHAEVAQVVFDPRELSYHDLLEIFFASHDPTTLNRQGADVGEQYRSIILYHSPEQKATAEVVIHDLSERQLWPNPIVTQVEPFTVFYPAEDYHRNYFETHPEAPYCAVVIAPKVVKFRKQFADRLKSAQAAK